MVRHYGKQHGEFLQKLQIELSYDSSVLLLDIFPNELKSGPQGHASHKSQGVKRTSLSHDGWVDKENMIGMCNGILVDFKKEGNSAICNNMGEPWEHYAKWNKPVTKGKILPGSTYV